MKFSLILLMFYLRDQIKTGIIVCKNFHKIHSELLDVIYSYFQKNFNNIFLHFILITEHVSFLP